MARRRDNDESDYFDEMRRLLDSTMLCFCPECGAECVIDFIDHGKALDMNSIEFTCDECGHFAADHDIQKGEWKLRGSDLLFLPNYEGNEFTLYQRFDEASYPSRREALEAKYDLMEGLVQPLLDNRAYDYFEKFNREVIICCRELSDMGVARFKGVLARYLLSSNADGADPDKLMDAELLEEIEALVHETDFQGMCDAIISAVAYESSGLDSGVNIPMWADMLVEKCLAESEGLKDSEKVMAYLHVCMVLNTIGDVMRSHKLANMTIDLIKRNISVIPDADELLSEAYSYTDPSLNSFEMSKEIFEHSRAHADENPEQYACALFELCLRSEGRPEERKRALEELDRYISISNDDPEVDPALLMRAYYGRYRIVGRSSDLQKAFDIAVDPDPFENGSIGISIVKEYLSSIRRDRRRLDKALRKLGMQGMGYDEAIDILNDCAWDMAPRFC